MVVVTRRTNSSHREYENHLSRLTLASGSNNRAFIPRWKKQRRPIPGLKRKRCRLRTINLSWSNIFTVASRIPGGRQLSSKSYLLLPNDLCALEMLGGCLSPLTNLLPYCHESHPWKSLSCLFLSFMAFHTHFSPLSCLVIELSCFFSPTIPLPLRVTSSSFIVRVTVFRRSDHVMISRSHSPLFYGTNGRAAVFFKVSRTSEIVPFIIDILLPRHAQPSDCAW